MINEMNLEFNTTEQSVCGQTNLNYELELMQHMRKKQF